MWKTGKWDVKLLACSDQFIHCEFYDVGGKLSHWISVIYAQNQLVNRKKLWIDIKNCANSIQGPWMVIGDFNNVLTVADRAGGKPVQPAEFYDLDCMMDEIGLYEHDTRGSHFTWSSRHTNGVIYSRIDRAICNREWFINYPNCEVEVLNPHISDHSPLRVRLLDTNTGMNRYQTRFKFLNCVMERPEFLDMVTNSWNKEEIGRPMYVLWRKLKRLQPILRGLTRKVTAGAQKIQDSRIQLEQAQHLLAGDIFNQEYITAVKYWSDEIIQTTELEEKILMQKSKITWLKLGDGN
jgi:hypothetical protein